MTTKLPGIPSIPAGITPQLKAYLLALTETVEVRTGVRGDPKDRAVTLRELEESGLAEELKARPFDPNNISDSNRGFTARTPVTNLAVPPAPTSFTASAGFTKVILEWNDPNVAYGNHAFTEIYRLSTDTIGDAVLVGVTTGFVYTDEVSTGTTNYYWVRFISDTAVKGPFNSGTGTAATTSELVTADIGDDAITQAKIADLAVGSAQIADLAVTSAKIANATIDTAKIADAAITDAKVSSLSGNKITTNTLNGNRVTADTLVLYDKADFGTMGSVRLNSGSSSNTTQQTTAYTSFVASSPRQVFSTTTLPQVLSRSYVFNMRSSSNRSFLFDIQFEPYGTYPSNAEMAYVMTLDTSSSSSAAGNKFVNYVLGTFSGSNAGTRVRTRNIVNLTSGTTYYLKVFAYSKNITGTRGFNTSVSVTGLFV